MVSLGNYTPIRMAVAKSLDFNNVKGLHLTHIDIRSTVPSSAILVGSVAAEWSYRAFGAPVPNFSILGGGGGGGGECSLLDLGPMLVPMSFPFYNRPNSLLSRPVCIVPNPMFRPQEEKSARCCRFESLSDSGFIAPNLAFYRPYKAQLDI